MQLNSAFGFDGKIMCNFPSVTKKRGGGVLMHTINSPSSCVSIQHEPSKLSHTISRTDWNHEERRGTLGIWREVLLFITRGLFLARAALCWRRGVSGHVVGRLPRHPQVTRWGDPYMPYCNEGGIKKKHANVTERTPAQPASFIAGVQILTETKAGTFTGVRMRQGRKSKSSRLLGKTAF